MEQAEWVRGQNQSGHQLEEVLLALLDQSVDKQIVLNENVIN